MEDELMENFLSEEDIYNIIVENTPHKNFKLEGFRYNPPGVKEGLMGTHLILNVKIKNEFGVSKELSFFAKLLPPPPNRKTAIEFGLFDKEIGAYNLFNEIGVQELKEVIPKCYHTKRNSILVFNDLVSEGYIMVNKNQPLSYKDLTGVLISLAKFHAGTIIYEEKNKKTKGDDYTLLQDYESILKEVYYSSESEESTKRVYAGILGILSQIDQYNIPQKLSNGKNLKQTILDMYPKLYEIVKPSGKYPNVICHADLWCTNFLLKREEKSTHCKFIDFQLVRYAPPTNDLLFVIYLTTTRAYRKEFLNKLLDLYYEEFGRVLKKYSIDVSKIFPYDNFKKSCEEQKFFGVFQSTTYYPVISLNHEYLKKYINNQDNVYKDRTPIINGDWGRDDYFNERMRESMDDIMEICEIFTANC